MHKTTTALLRILANAAADYLELLDLVAELGEPEAWVIESLRGAELELRAATAVVREEVPSSSRLEM